MEPNLTHHATRYPGVLLTAAVLATGPVMANGDLPDLRTQSIRTSSPVTEGIQTSFAPLICNIGTGATLIAPVVRAIVSGDNTPYSDTQDVTLPRAFGPGFDCIEQEFLWTPPVAAATDPDLYSLRIVIDPDNLIAESNEVNNDATWSNILSVQSSPVPQLSCLGYFAPFHQPLSIRNKSKGTIPLKIELVEVDNGGYPLTDSDIIAPPVVNVTYNGMTYGDGTDGEEVLEPVGMSNDGNVFAYNPDTWQWEYRLGTKQFSAAGTYEVSVHSGDESEYTFHTSCSQVFSREE